MDDLINSLEILLASNSRSPRSNAISVMKLIAAGLRHVSCQPCAVDVSFATWTTAKWIETELADGTNQLSRLDLYETQIQG